MRNVASVLGVVVTAVLSGCGGKTSGVGTTALPPGHGTIAPDGTTTLAEHRTVDESCGTWDEWSYALDPSFTCGDVLQIAANAKCSALCADEGATCSFDVPDTGDEIAVGPQSPEVTSAACPPMPTELKCMKPLAQIVCPVAGAGRRPDGLRELGRDAYRSLADYFACAAHLEAAAVLAFERLESELRAYAAPSDLLERVAQAEREERRHVVLTTALARRFGAEPPPAVADSTSHRTLFAIAKENVVEGVVRETFGAAIAIHRARRAADDEVRETLAVIAADECRHAELSWDLHEWMVARLTEDERARIEEARLDALRDLGETLANAEPAPELALLAGVPTRREALRLFDAVAAVLWHAAA